MRLSIHIWFLAAIVLAGVETVGNEERAHVEFRSLMEVAQNLPSLTDFRQSQDSDDVMNLERARVLVRNIAQDIPKVSYIRTYQYEYFEIQSDLRKLARLIVEYGKDQVRKSDYDLFVDDVIALLKVGWYLAESQSSLDSFLFAHGIHSIVGRGVAKAAAYLPFSERNRLLELWPSVPEDLLFSKVAVEDHIEGRQEIWELFVGTVEGLPSSVPNAIPEGAEVAKIYRLSCKKSSSDGVLAFRDLETGDDFLLSSGETHEGLALLFWDERSRFGLLKKENMSAVVNLTECAFRTVDPNAAWKRFQYFAEEEQRLFDSMPSMGDIDSNVDAEDELERILNEADGDVCEGFLNILKRYDSDFSRIRPFLQVSYKELPDAEEIISKLGFTMRQPAFALIKLRRNELRSRLFEELVLTGVRYLQDRSLCLPESKITEGQIQLKMNEHRVMLRVEVPDPDDEPIEVEFRL